MEEGNRFSFISRMPDQPGALYRVAEIIKMYGANINRIHYDHNINPCVVFFEVTCSHEVYKEITDELGKIGYLQTSLDIPAFLKINVYLSNRPGTLLEFLEYTTAAGANIVFVDFDDKGSHPEKITISLTLENSSAVDELLNRLKSRYRLEIVEYDVTGEHLDETVFYIRFAQELRGIIGEREDSFLLRLLHDISRIVQELNNLGEDPRQVFRSIITTGKTLRDTTGESFYADVQRIELHEDVILYCFQPPCGGNVFLLASPGEKVIVDTGFGIYYRDLMNMLGFYGFGDLRDLENIYITHADADHCGAAGYFNAVSWMHSGTYRIIKEANRAYGSRTENSILEELYTKLINTFSNMNPPKRVEVFPSVTKGKEGIFPVIDVIDIAGLEFEVLESIGGHVHGQIFLLCREQGLFFMGDSLINFNSLTSDRKRFNSLAKVLMTSVNVDSEKARLERRALLDLAAEVDEDMSARGGRCLLCCGHGAVSILSGDGMETYGRVERYTPR